jgi:tetratricopeptide (TPR) repeat protein
MLNLDARAHIIRTKSMAANSMSPGRVINWIFLALFSLAIAACSSPEERAQAHYASGMELLQSGDFVRAGLEFRNALDFNEKLAAAWMGLATVEEQKQNWPAVTESLERVTELDPKNFDSFLKLSKLLLAAIKLDQALKNVNLANGLKSNDTNVLALRAAILFRLNDREGARADAERALSLEPNNPDAHAVLAADLMASGNTTAALQFIDRGLTTDPNNLGLLMFKLKIFEDTKDDAKLEATLRHLITAYPAAKEMRQALLAFLMDRKRHGDVEAEMRSILAADPGNTAQALDLVRFVGATKGAAAARTELEKFISEKPEVADFKFALAQMDFAEKRSEAATASLEAIIAKGGPANDILRSRLLLANMNIGLGHADKAKTLINQVLESDAKNADALALRASLKLDSGEVDGAVADLREALNQQPTSVALLMLLGRAHERQGSVDLANDRLAQAIKISNYSPQVALDYVVFLGRRSKNDVAETVLNEAVARHPNDIPLLKALAQFRLNRQDWVGAQKAAEALKNVGDKSGLSDQIVGVVLLGQKKYDESIVTLKEAYTEAPDAVRPMYSLFLAYMQAGKTSEAEAFIQSVLATNETNADARVLLGSLRMLQKKPQEAETQFKTAITHQPANPAGYVALAKYHLSQQKVTEAEATLLSGREKAPRDLALNLLLAGLLETKGETERAIAIYEEQLKATPDALIVINNLASLLADYRTDTGSLERAHQLAQRLATIDVPQFKDTLGWVAYLRGDYRTALLNIEPAVEKLPDVALARYHLAMTYLALKRNADARAEFTKTETLLKADDPLREKIRTALARLDASN